MILLLAWPAAAWAYIDPGSGMLFWQGLIAAAGAVLVFLRSLLQLVRRLIGRFKNEK
jgi:hypothetical protein